MNTVAVKAFLRGAMQEDPSDEQIEDLIEYLQSFLKTQKYDRLALKYLKENVSVDDWEGLDIKNWYGLADCFHETGLNYRVEQEIQDDAGILVNWEYIFQELQRASSDDK